MKQATLASVPAVANCVRIKHSVYDAIVEIGVLKHFNTVFAR